MDESAKVITRGWVDMLIGASLFVAALVALCFPVHLSTYDQWGVQLKCGNGYHADLLQATVDDQGHDPQDPQFTQGGASRAVRPVANFADQCKSAIAHRRAWTIPVATLGALIVIPELVAWARGGGSPSSDASINAWSGTPSDAAERDTSIQAAAFLDRRKCSHRARASNTTF
ncbi:hypothetical protein [Mycobacterium kyorinense]|uniref:Uncharacterized protein n=1 Tax=Mycobacterium kyorinense TaxID=487514 RepID=A0A1X1XJW3_9MYCO|nr:hypothetical protein [Mycobacterium kyorinense]ORV99018.1 hypothetical protein AWC14_12385 [Mycobacterium kyorinense]